MLKEKSIWEFYLVIEFVNSSYDGINNIINDDNRSYILE